MKTPRVTESLGEKLEQRGELRRSGCAVAGENQEKVADQNTLALFKRFSRNRNVEKARVEFEPVQKVEEKFH